MNSDSSNIKFRLYKRALSPFWWAEAYVDGERVRLSTKEIDRLTAESRVPGLFKGWSAHQRHTGELRPSRTQRSVPLHNIPRRGNKDPDRYRRAMHSFCLSLARALVDDILPADADMGEIFKVYYKAASLTVSSGVKHEVDHITPVSKGGLHHQDNLEAVPRILNRLKGGREGRRAKFYERYKVRPEVN